MMDLWMNLVFFVLITHLTCLKGQNKTKIYIGGFFPVDNNNWDASGLVPAAQLAIMDINNNTELLADYELIMEWNNTMCDTGVGLSGLFDQIQSAPKKVMLLGAGCTTVTGPMAETAQYWNLVQISHTSSSPSLNNRRKYPFLFRLYPSEESMNFPRLELMKKFGWHRASLLYSTEGAFSVVIQHMRDLLLANNKLPVLMESFSGDPEAALKSIKDKESRIIIVNMFDSSARKAFCTAHKLGMTGGGYVWIIPGWFSEKWWLIEDTTCTPEEMAEAVNGYISMETQATDQATKITDGGRTPLGFHRAYENLVSQTTYEPHDLAPFAYDSVFTIAVALNDSIVALAKEGFSLEDFDYTRQDIARVFFDKVNNSAVSGITGPISFDINGKRLGYTKLEQLQDGQEIALGIFDDSERDFLVLNVSGFNWFTSDGGPPPDGPIELEEWRTVSFPLLIAMTVIASGGVIFVIFLVAINIKYRHRKIMRLSSPNLNYVICVGCFFMYSFVILLGVDSTVLQLDEKPSTFFKVMCLVKQWLLPVAFSLTFGATFVKAWRIHRIFANSKMKKRTIKDSQLLLIVCVLVVIDAILLATWDILDMPIGKNTTLANERKTQDLIIIPRVEHCQNEQENVWIGVFLGYKGLLLLYGALLAWENRAVSIDVLSDARNIGITIYTTVVLCCVVVPVALVFKEEMDFAYASISGTINFATTVLLALCFIPKVHILFTNTVSTENMLINSMITKNQRNGELRTEDKLVGDLTKKIKELEATIEKYSVNGKLNVKSTDCDITATDGVSLVKYNRSSGSDIELRSVSQKPPDSGTQGEASTSSRQKTSET